MTIKAITIPEYAERRGVSPSAVSQAITKGSKLIDVDRYEKIGGTWILYFRNSVAKKNIGKCIELTNP